MASTDLNPIIPGFAPDPSITLIGDVFFLVTSSFHLFPGLAIYSSRDLCNWQHVGNAINRPNQLSLAHSVTNLKNEGLEELIPATGGLYAPTIRHFRGVTYIVCTNVIHDLDDASTIKFENFIISTTDIRADAWSDPVYFDLHGIDPSLYFDEKGRAYIQGSIWGVETTINCFEIDLATGAKLSEEKVIWHGYTKIIPEGPHLYRRGDWIYLLVAEGGTHEGHHITVARSKSVFGPFESFDGNPILKPASPNDPVQYTGHGDIFQDLRGNWWMVCLGARKTGDRCLFGRETFLSPVTWGEDEWPCLSPIQMNFSIAYDELHIQPNKVAPMRALLPFIWIRDPGPLLSETQIVNRVHGATISLVPSTSDLGDCAGPTAFVGKRPRQYGTATVHLDTRPLADYGPIKAGLALYKDEHRFTRVYWDGSSSTVVVELVNCAKTLHRVIDAQPCPRPIIRLVMTYGPDQIDFALGSPGMQQLKRLGSVDVVDLSGPDFVGPVIGVFATGGSVASREVVFKNFMVDV